MQCYWPIAEPLIGTATVDSTKLNQWQQLTWRNIRSSWSTGTAQAFRFDFEGMASGKIAYIDDEDDVDQYKIVGSQEADPFESKISNESPIAKALMGHKVGDVVSVESPNGNYEVKVIEIN